MEEVYSFAARVAERGMRQILIIPEDPQALLEYFERARLPSTLYCAAKCSASPWGAKLWLSKATERKECSIRSRRKTLAAVAKCGGSPWRPCPSGVTAPFRELRVREVKNASWVPKIALSPDSARGTRRLNQHTQRGTRSQ